MAGIALRSGLPGVCSWIRACLCCGSCASISNAAQPPSLDDAFPHNGERLQLESRQTSLVWWHTSLIPALGRQRQADFWVWGQPGLQSEFQCSQGYKNPCLQKKKKKKILKQMTAATFISFNSWGCCVACVPVCCVHSVPVEASKRMACPELDYVTL